MFVYLHISLQFVTQCITCLNYNIVSLVLKIVIAFIFLNYKHNPTITNVFHKLSWCSLILIHSQNCVYYDLIFVNLQIMLSLCKLHSHFQYTNAIIQTKSLIFTPHSPLLKHLFQMYSILPVHLYSHSCSYPSL